MGEKERLGVEEIMRVLPHRFPFLMVDRITELDSQQGRVVGIKNVSVNEWYFQGHFPEQKVMPGVLIVEAMAQAGGILLMHQIDDPQSKLVYFMTIERAKFKRPVVPGDQLRLEVTQVARRSGYCKMRGRALVDGVVVAEADMTSAIVDRPRQ